MAEFSWGSGGTSVIGFTDQWVQVGGIWLPAGRAMANGNTSVMVTHLTALVSGRNGTRTITLSLGPVVASFARGAESQASWTGWRGTNNALVNGGQATFRISGNGSFYFGRGGAGTSVDSYGTNFSGTLGGGGLYAQAPSTPGTPTLTQPQPTRMRAVWAGPADDGGSAVTGYTVQYATNSSFSGATTVTLGVVGSYEFNVTPGTTYYVRVAARNAVTTAAGTTGAWSGTRSSQAFGGLRVRDNGAYKQHLVYVREAGVQKLHQPFVKEGGVYKSLA